MIPGITASYKIKADNMDLMAALLARQLSYNGPVEDDDTSTVGFSVNLSGKVMIGQDDLKFSATMGNGVGRYVGLGAVADAALVGDDLKASETTAVYIAYSHHWNSEWRSSVVYCMLSADYDDSVATGVTDVSSVRVNIMRSPVKPLAYGAE